MSGSREENETRLVSLNRDVINKLAQIRFGIKDIHYSGFMTYRKRLVWAWWKTAQNSCRTWSWSTDGTEHACHTYRVMWNRAAFIGLHRCPWSLLLGGGTENPWSRYFTKNQWKTHLPESSLSREETGKHLGSGTWVRVATFKCLFNLSGARAISSNTKKDVIQNMLDPSVFDSENNYVTFSTSKVNATEKDQQLLKTPPRVKQADHDHTPLRVKQAEHDDNVTGTGDSAELLRCSCPPSLSPKDTTDGTTTAMSATSEAFSDGSRLSRDRYMGSSTSSSLPLPNSLSDKEERFICPLEVCCSKYTNKRNITFVILKMMSGSFFKCFPPVVVSWPT